MLPSSIALFVVLNINTASVCSVHRAKLHSAHYLAALVGDIVVVSLELGDDLGERELGPDALRARLFLQVRQVLYLYL